MDAPLTNHSDRFCYRVDLVIDFSIFLFFELRPSGFVDEQIHNSRDK